MVIHKVFPFLLMIYVAKGDVDFAKMCKNDYRDMNGIQIDVSKYFSNNNGVCIEKCCGSGEMFAPNGTCMNTVEVFTLYKKFRRLASDVNYSNIVLFSWANNIKIKSEKDFVFIRNHRDAQCTVEEDTTNEYFIVDDGSIRIQDTNLSKLWFTLEKLQYCIDFKLQPVNHTLAVKLIVKEYISDNTDDDKKAAFLLVGLLVSSFFLLLVLVVYSLLPKLQNLIGLVLMSYTASILVTFLFKIFIKLTNKSLSQKSCKIISPMMYFAAVSSFFWLNVMSYDVWWSLRGHRKRRDINRRGERVKFMWYCLYAWGVPLLMTIIVTVLDNSDLSNWDIVKIPFDDCFAYEKGVTYYLNIPIGIIIFVNIILFGLTVYNIWMIKRAVHRCEDSRRSKQDTNRFITYIKLSVVMGVSWILELVPSTTSIWLFILTTTYNLLIGVAIFFLFVFNKQILIQLCKRFNIKNNLTKKWGTCQGTRSGVSRTTGTASVKGQSHEMEFLKDRPKGDSCTDA